MQVVLEQDLRYIKEKGYDDLDVLVAFSGTVNDNGEDYTEEKIKIRLIKQLKKIS